jgi:hypothetical protein
MSRDFIQSLEDRRLLSASLGGTTLTVTGGSGVDNIAITKNATSLLVKQNGVTKSFKLSAVAKIVVNAGAGNDTVNVAADITKPSTLNGGDGNDTLGGGGGNDSVNGGAGADKVKGNGGADTEIGGTGDDNLDGGDGNDNLQGNDGNDTETGSGGNDKLSGGNGNDKLFGGSGNDSINGDAGNDLEAGEDGDDVLDGGDNDDTIDGGAGDDDLAGKAGVNTLKGGTGKDTFVSGNGADVLTDEEDDDDGEDGGTDHPEEGKVGFGTVTAVDTVAGTITITVLGEKGTTSTKTFTVTASTVITANDLPVALGALPLGLKVFVVTDPATPTVAAKIVAVAACTEGKVVSVDTTLSTITLVGRDGKPNRVFTVAANAVVTINGVPGTLADVVAGAEVKLQLWALDPTVAVGIKVHTENEGGGGGGGVHNHKAAGAVVSTDLVANTITITGEPGAANRTFTLAVGATITVDGVATTLDKLPAGLKVVLALDESTPALVTSIAASGKVVEGKISAVDPLLGTLTLAAHEGLPATTYTIPTTAKITLDGVVVTLDKLTVGAEVRIQLSAADGSVLAVSVHSEDGDDDEGDEGHGQVVSVDTLNSKITLSIQKEGVPAVQTTFTVDPAAKIKLDGQLVTLDKLGVGLKVEFVTSSTDPTVLIEIDAESQKVEGRIASVNVAAGTVTLQGKEGQVGKTYTLASGAVITLNKLVTTLDKIPVNAEVNLFLAGDGSVSKLNAFAGGGEH